MNNDKKSTRKQENIEVINNLDLWSEYRWKQIKTC